MLLMLAAVLFDYLGRLASLPPEYALWPANLIYLAAPAAFVAIGGLIAVKRPRNAYGWVMLANGVGQGSIQGFWTSYGIYSYHVAPEPLPLAALAFEVIAVGWLLFMCTLPLLLLLYPSGHLRSPRWKPAIGLLLTAFVVGVCTGWMIDASIGWIAVSNPYALTGNARQIAETLVILAVVVMFLLIVASAVSLIVNAWRSTGVERQQYKWFAYAAALFIVEFIVDIFWEPRQPWEALKETVPLVLLASAIGMAVLRYRLWDIDVVIRKTLVYAALTVLLTLVYFGSVVLLQGLFSRLAGVQQSTLAVVISTLAIAALFTPVRRRIHDWIDCRFFRKKYDAQQVLARFAITARDETDMNVLTAELARVVQETLEPERVAVWLRRQDMKQS
jgi:hypothetical protein